MTKWGLLQECKGSLTSENSANKIHNHQQTKEENHIISSLESKKAFNRSQHPLIIKVHSILEI